MRQTHQINQLDKTNKANKSHHTTLGIIATLVLSTIIGIGIYSGISIANANTTNALSYNTNEDISFTFAPTLSIGLSANSLTIDNLVPGTTSDSNTVTVTVSSNTPYGYVLSAGVGSTVSTDPYYDTSDLVHDSTTTQVPTTNKFSSIATSASLESLTTDNTWGYSTSTNGGTSWSTYSGLSHTETKPLLDISDPATPSTIDFKIAARSATTQASGTYNNVITFYAVGKPEPKYLYDEVAKMSKGTQITADLRTTITAPTSKDYREDTSNSGVYEYNSAVFGESSDASNANKIYYYRGVLEPEEDQGSYGSDGKATTYPNYVKLDNDTCWRIVRTTGSGGVKMIYNGVWTGSTCANRDANAQISNSAFNGTSSTYQQVVRAGYTYNGNYASNSTTKRTLATLFGTNDNDNNVTSSDIKTVMDTWYGSSLNAYTSSLENSAGYCGDRTVFLSGSSSVQPESLQIPQYSNNGNQQCNFGAFTRNLKGGRYPSLTCAEYQNLDRSKVDLYTVVDTTTGNGRLVYPSALLNGDEASLAGSGCAGQSYCFSRNAKSFLGSGAHFWLLSPAFIGSNKSVIYIQAIHSSNYLFSGYSYHSLGVRPVISLKPGATAISGSGTATDPWVVPAP